MQVSSIKKQIAAMGEEKIKSIQEKYTFKGITPYEYQCVMFDEIGKRIGRYTHPFYVKASVSAGKTVGFAMVAARLKEMVSKEFPRGLPFMVLARQAEIVSQDSEEISNFGVPNSIYCAGISNVKSAYYPVVVGSEGTVVNGLMKGLGDYAPLVLGIDECHQVDWRDLAEAIEADESMSQMSTKKEDFVPNPSFVSNEAGQAGLPYLIGEDGEPMKGTGRAQYTQVIIHFMRKCREVHKKELRVFGMTGSEFRGTEPILVEDKNMLGFWREQVTNIDTNYLVEFGSVVPTVFGGNEGLGYDLGEFNASSQDGTQDFTQAQLNAMQKKIHDSGTMTQQIMDKVVELTKDRLAVLVTCAGQRHCKEAAAALPEGTTYAIITDQTSAKQRKKILDDVREGKIKFTFQVMALTTGVNIPNWDVCVILRKIGSLTLLIQLIGRVMRLLKPWHIEQGMVKNDCVVYDFAGTMDELGQLYFDPILEQAQFQRKFDNKETKKCPICGTENSYYARRCMHLDDNGCRCEYFWKSRRCEDQIDQRTGKVIINGCGTENDVVARVCRCCDVTLLDPNLKLTGKAYTKNDWCDVLNFDVELTNNRSGVIYTYWLRDAMGTEFRAREIFFPESDNQICKTVWRKKGIQPHVEDKAVGTRLAVTRNAIKIISMKEHIRAPLRVTHRINGKKEDVISRKDFGGEIDN